MNSVNSFRYFMNSANHDMHKYWDSKDKLTELRNTIINYKNIKSGNFNYTFGVLGFIFYHTFTIYYNKQVLHLMESKALPHLFICAAFGVASGYLVGYYYGNSIKNTRMCSKLDDTLGARISELSK